ncbi:alpha/beta hydrolase [Dokdonella sp.]|uniref:alpha/beta hydrolase n=1 Tax=Dokdonella sp. TaxID=2291710 RepID=UPI003529015E
MKKNHRIAVAVALVVAVVAYSRLHKSTGADTTAPSSRGQYLISAHAESFRFGSLEFKACALTQEHSAATTEAYCAPFEVMENRADPASRRIQLRLALVAANGAADDDFIVFLAGGPGQSAVDSWPRIAPALAFARRHRHVLLLDQRGTGESNPLNCAALADGDAMPEFDPQRMAEQTRACAEEVGMHADPRYYSTSDAVADLEELRQALGAPRFDLVGVSYGTRLAQHYTRRHTEGVRSMVLDSVVPNELALGGEFAINLDNALKAQFANCAAHPACAAAFPDPYTDLMRLRDQLREAPRDVHYADPISFEAKTARLDAFGLAGLIRLFAYSPETAALIPHTVSEALAGNDAALMGQMGVIAQGVEELAGSGMQLSVVCAEDADRLVADASVADTLLGNQMVEMMQSQCAIWPHGERPPDFNEPARGDTPVLVLEGELDPVTPPRYGEQVVAGLEAARLIVVKGQGHNVIGRGCLPKLVSEFMDTLDPAALDVACADELGQIPHFIDFNGAAP